MLKTPFFCSLLAKDTIVWNIDIRNITLTIYRPEQAFRSPGV
jgi:hypothetical protein